jgi:hypothetical protein
MFTAEQRDYVRKHFLELAQSDPRVIAGALTGSMAFGDGDEWSDIDVAFGIAEGITPEAVLDDWTHVLAREWGLLDHFDLRSGSSVYRVFLLPSGLEVDVGVTPAEDFGARGPNFRALFGPTQQPEATPQPSSSSLIGLSWHHVLHARASIERHKLWQAEYWISAIRDHTLALACLRLGENAREWRGIDRLSPAVTDPLADREEELVLFLQVLVHPLARVQRRTYDKERHGTGAATICNARAETEEIIPRIRDLLNRNHKIRS